MSSLPPPWPRAALARLGETALARLNVLGKEHDATVSEEGSLEELKVTGYGTPAQDYDEFLAALQRKGNKQTKARQRNNSRRFGKHSEFERES